MPKRKAVVAELIRRVLHGDRVKSAKRDLVAAGPSAVVPALEAATGAHGRMSPGREGETLAHLVDVLERIAKQDARPVAAALAHDVPGRNLVVWALGRSGSRHARAVLKELAQGEDEVVRAVARYHVEVRKRAKKRKSARKA